MKKWKIRYKGFIITYDPLGFLACYWEDGPVLDWLYLGSRIDVIKSEIDRRIDIWDREKN